MFKSLKKIIVCLLLCFWAIGARGQEDIYLQPESAPSSVSKHTPKRRIGMLIGLKGAYNRTVFDANLNLRNASLQNYNDVSTNFFVVVEDRKNKFEISFEPGYMRLRGGIEQLDKLGTAGGPDTNTIITWGLNLINIPIALRYVLVQAARQKLALYATAGLELNLVNSARVSFEQSPKQPQYADVAYNRITNQMSKSNIRWLLGVGGRYHISPYSYGFVEIRNMFGSGQNAMFVYNQNNSGQKFNLVFDSLQFSVGLATRIF